uniref:Uncharacterized protein n=1 Tax=Fagus sylvatica TaxID=28930 RepID=A0A2N9H7N0_FAGSY
MPLGLACPPSSLSSPHPRFFLQQESSPQGTAIANPLFDRTILGLGRCLPAPFQWEIFFNCEYHSAVCLIKGALESLDQQGFIVCVLVPSSGSTFAGEPGHTGEICVSKKSSNPVFSSKPSILPSNWESLPSGFGGVGGLGNRSMLM